MKKTMIKALIVGLFPVSALAFDNGARVVGCDYKFGSVVETDTCLILGSGMQMGILWVAFKAGNQRFRYFSDAPNVLEQIDGKGNRIRSHSIRNTQAQCRPGGVKADRYQFRNGDYVCLYD